MSCFAHGALVWSSDICARWASGDVLSSCCSDPRRRVSSVREVDVAVANAGGAAVVGALRVAVGALRVAAGVGRVEAAAGSAAAAAAVAHVWSQEKLRHLLDLMGLVRRLPRAVKVALPQEVSRHVL